MSQVMHFHCDADVTRRLKCKIFCFFWYVAIQTTMGKVNVKIMFMLSHKVVQSLQNVKSEKVLKMEKRVAERHWACAGL